ncbi:zinc dependent phospholipase C family protein [Candidatus Woesearchaeota archaeon]|nr:zinc dependent phospholipase C family protein [Candidatus Woesearchaeota archaeon]
MSKIGLIILLFVFALLSGWNSELHKGAVDAVYYSMPYEVRKELNLSYMEYGSVAPDKKFKDFTNHKYPYSYEKSKKWLEYAKTAYGKKEFNNASYSFGVASHYILDSYSAPHYVVHENYKMHETFENSSFEFNLECKDYGLTLDYLNYKDNGGKDWADWVETKNSNIQKEALEKGMKMVYSQGLRAFNFNCYEKRTALEDYDFIGENLTTALVFIFVLIIILRFF